jgi:hypothetical protein
MIINPSEHDYRDIYKLMVGVIVPRPIAFVSTVSAMVSAISPPSVSSRGSAPIHR